MTHPTDSLMNDIHDLCQQSIEEHVPYESKWFDLIWSHFWRMLKCDSLDDYSGRTLLNGVSKGNVLHIGASGGDDTFDSLQLIAPIVGAAARLKNQKGNRKLDYKCVTDAIVDEAMGLNVTTRMLGILQEHAVPMVAKLFDVYVPDADTSPSDDPNLLLVEWCDGSQDELYEPIPSSQRLDISSVEQRFRVNHQNFNLFVDETAPRIMVHNCKDNLWKALGPSQRVLLGMILPSLRTRRPLVWSNIAEKALMRECPPLLEQDATAVRRCWSELNRRLKSVLKPVIQAEHGLKTYAPHGCISYCWIRPASGETRLTLD